MKPAITPVVLRKAGPEDLERLRAISIATFLETFAASNTAADMDQYLEENMTEERLLQELQDDGSSFYLAFLEEELAGYLKINTGAAQTEQLPGSSLEIERIYVPVKYKGKGIGQQLMIKAFNIAAEQHIKTVWLGVWEHNDKAISFYRKLGFEPFDQHVFRLGSDEQTDILMKMVLVK